MYGDIALRVIGVARGLIGVPYALYLNPRIKQQPTDGLSCIALVCYVLESVGVTLPGGLRRTRDLVSFDIGQEVADVRELMPADILVLRGVQYGPPEATHCDLYAGGGKVIHSSRAVGQVSEQPLEVVLGCYLFLGARRILNGH